MIEIFRMFQIMFLVVGLAMFTTVIPEAMVLVSKKEKYRIKSALNMKKRFNE